MAALWSDTRTRGVRGSKEAKAKFLSASSQHPSTLHLPRHLVPRYSFSTPASSLWPPHSCPHSPYYLSSFTPPTCIQPSPSVASQYSPHSVLTTLSSRYRLTS
ncbi:hypothetical protein E2C01_004437 [Portunus trituberculatus]|uniref:Uncharacterized protein n=1 Tax=Portunus trituberculatus TaxID=210409 RepID=A0A5B7CPZ3_PORTR|nr:hypothetical protein [Portunus trituberculatus]